LRQTVFLPPFVVPRTLVH